VRDGSRPRRGDRRRAETAATAAKRALDVVAAGVLALVAAPVVALGAIGVACSSPGPVLFVQERAGRHGRPFRVFKLRTMRADAETVLAAHLASDPAAAAEWARYGGLADDPRVAGPVGRLLRRTSVDELPQLWNVVRGEMSLVGPRPLDRAVRGLCDPEHLAVRERVRPGLTGAWQVAGRNDVDLAGMRELDLAYVQAWRPRLDARILARTPGAVLRRRGAR
jgi:lipopolysaccharide/colanic/teichoic acid biosynthesis glycosyltransferase